MFNILKKLKAISGSIGFNYLPIEKRQITFYSEGESYWPHLSGLLEVTLKEINKSVCYVTSSLEDPGIKIDHPNLNKFYIGSSSVRDQFFKDLNTNILITTMPDLDKYSIKRSKYNVHYIYVQHSLVSLHSVYRHGAFDHYDTICAAGPHHVKEIRAIEEKYNLPKKKIIKLGYSRLDNLIKFSNKDLNYKNSKIKSCKKILIAPSWGPEGIIEIDLGKNLIENLLNQGHEVILRPHPQTIKLFNHKVKEICNKYKNDFNFYLDDNVNSHDSFFQSDIMISDWSGVAFEYFFAFNKPIIFCDVPNKINNLNYRDIGIVPFEMYIREKIGIIWDGISPIKEIIQLCLLKQNKDFDNLRNKHCFNVKRSDKVFAETLKSFF